MAMESYKRYLSPTTSVAGLMSKPPRGILGDYRMTLPNWVRLEKVDEMGRVIGEKWGAKVRKVTCDMDKQPCQRLSSRKCNTSQGIGKVVKLKRSQEKIIRCCGSIGIFGLEEAKEGLVLADELLLLVEKKLGFNGGGTASLKYKEKVFRCEEAKGCPQLLMWRTMASEVNGLKKLLRALGGSEELVGRFRKITEAMISRAKLLARDAFGKEVEESRCSELVGRILGAKIQMSKDSREKELVVTRPRVDTTYDTLSLLHRKGIHVFRSVIPLDHFGVWQNLYDKLTLDAYKVKGLVPPEEAVVSKMLFVAKGSYAMVPIEQIYSENFRTSVGGNKHLEVIVMLSPPNIELKTWLNSDPEYYCWGQMEDCDLASDGKDDRGMIVYPFDKVAGRDRHIVASEPLEAVIQGLCLIKEVSRESYETTCKRLEEWGYERNRKAKAARMYRTKKRLGKDNSMNDETKKKQRSVPVMENEWEIAIPSM